MNIDINEFFVSIDDKDVPEHLTETTVKWRKLASDLGYTGPVCWRVREGFTLKDHAPKVGPCYEEFRYLKSWALKNDEPTKSCLVLFIPCLLDKSKNKTVDEQIELLSEWRKYYALPGHHLTSFGSAAMICGLVLVHFKRTGERTPVSLDWVRTDTLRLDSDRLTVGDFGCHGLHCDDYHWDGYCDDGLGVFPLGVELI